MQTAYRTIGIGILIQGIGFLWDLYIHLDTNVKEGLDEFFKIPAHDLIVAGFLITIAGFALLRRALRQ